MKNKCSEACLGPYQTIMIVTRRKDAVPPKMVSAQSKNENPYLGYENTSFKTLLCKGRSPNDTIYF